MASIRRNALLWTACSLTAVVAFGTVALDITLRNALLAEFDDALRARAEGLAALVRWDGTRVEFDFAEERASWPQERSAGDGFAVFVGDGDGWRLIERFGQPLVDAAQVPVGVRDLEASNANPRRAFTLVQQVKPEAEDEGDVAAGSVGSTDGRPTLAVRVVAIADRARLDRQLALLRERIWIAGLVMIGAALGATAAAIVRGLRPLGTLASVVARIDPAAHSEPIDTASLPSELGPIAEQLNALRVRAEAAVTRERWFASAASHELRTPIAELRTMMEVALLRERTDEEWRRLSGSAIAVVARMQALTEVLLAATRSPGHGPAAAEMAELSVVPALQRLADRVCEAAGIDRTVVSLEHGSTPTIFCNAALFEAIVGNILRNAVEHGAVSAQQPVSIRVMCSDDRGRLGIVVSNHAPMLTASDLERMFDPLWRGDASRNDQSHFGLGLPIARTLAARIGGSISASLMGTGVLQMSIEIPSESSWDGHS